MSPTMILCRSVGIAGGSYATSRQPTGGNSSDFVGWPSSTLRYLSMPAVAARTRGQYPFMSILMTDAGGWPLHTDAESRYHWNL